MNKLPNLTAVRREEIKTQTDLDNMARVANQHGYELWSQYICTLKDYIGEYIGVSVAAFSLQGFNLAKGDALNVISLAEFLDYDMEKEAVSSGNKYDREVIGKCGAKVVVDVYRVLDGFSCGNPILDHITKKSLCAGMRGHKDLMTDLQDIKWSIEEAIKLEGQR